VDHHAQKTAPAVNLAAIQDSLAQIRDAIQVSPCPKSHNLTELTGASVYLKLENLQRTGAFKERGALTKLLSLSPAERQAGLVAASAGNHAQGVACHATRLGMRSEIWMPLTTPGTKILATSKLGAEVKLIGTNFDETFHAALQHAHSSGATFIHPFDDERVIAGQGTLGLELLEQRPDVQAILVPVGGGGLIAGVATAIKESNPSIAVIGVQTAGIPSMAEALKHGRPTKIKSKPTIAEGIAVRSAGTKTLPIIQKYVDDLILVEEDEIAAAVLFLLEEEKTLAEGAGAVTVAALLHKKVSLAGKTVVAVVSGGNVDVSLLSRIIERGLVKDGRLVRLRIALPDYPGTLLRLTEIIAQNGINIVETSYSRTFHGARLGHTVIDLTLETRGIEHWQDLTAALEKAGYDFDQIL
jgi:threonine dehydratase